MEKSEELNALCGKATGATPTALPGTTDASMDGAVASMAMAMAGLMEPAEAAALRDAAATLVKGGDDGDARADA